MTSTMFQPLTLNNGTVIKNRFVKPAMSEILGDHQQRPTQLLVNLYREWVQGGAGLLITGNVMVDRTASVKKATW